MREVVNIPHLVEDPKTGETIRTEKHEVALRGLVRRTRLDLLTKHKAQEKDSVEKMSLDKQDALAVDFSLAAIIEWNVTPEGGVARAIPPHEQRALLTNFDHFLPRITEGTARAQENFDKELADLAKNF
jgi:hypothetical protein